MKKSIKKTLSVILAVVMLLSATQILSFAAIPYFSATARSEYENTIAQYTLEYENEAGEKDGKVQVGEWVTIRAKIKGLDSLGLAQIYFYYDDTKLKPISQSMLDFYTNPEYGMDDPDIWESELGYRTIEEAMLYGDDLTASSINDITVSDISTNVKLPTRLEYQSMCTTQGDTGATTSNLGQFTGGLTGFPWGKGMHDEVMAGSVDAKSREAAVVCGVYGQGKAIVGASYGLGIKYAYYDWNTGTKPYVSHIRVDATKDTVLLEVKMLAIAEGNANLSFSDAACINTTQESASSQTTVGATGWTECGINTTKTLSAYDVITVNEPIVSNLVIGASQEVELDYSALEAALEAAEAINTTKYTAASVAVLTAAVEAAEAIMAAKDTASAASQEEITAAAAAIDAAIDALACAHNDKTLVTDVPATCGTDGYGHYDCNDCDDNPVETNVVIPKTGNHVNKTLVVDQPATCAAVGSGHYVCDECKQTVETNVVIPKSNDHNYSWVVSKAATDTEAGEEEYKCSVCGDVSDTRVIPATGYILTVEAENGTVAANGLTDGKVYTPRNTATNVTLTATANAGYEFAYWTVDGRIVSNDAVYTVQVGYTSTIKAVFTPISDTTTYTVTFIAFGKVLYVDTVDSGASATAPADPTYTGYKFDCWDTDFSAVTSDLTVTAKFIKDTAVTYSVTGGTGVTITGNSVGENLYNYDTKVTATFDSTTLADGQKFQGWTVNGGASIISYDATYSFYVGANVLVEAVIGTVAAEPEASSGISYATDGTKVIILAERNAPAGYTFVAAGIIATRDVTKALTVESAEANSNVSMKTTTATTVAGQYTFTFNVTGGGTLYFASFAMYMDGNGNVVTVYSETCIASV